MHTKMWVATALLLLSFGVRASGAQESLKTYSGGITPYPQAFASLLRLPTDEHGAFILEAGLFEVHVRGVRLGAKGGFCEDAIPLHAAKNAPALSIIGVLSPPVEPRSWKETPEGLYVRCLPAGRAKIRLQLIVPNAAVPASRQLSGLYQPFLYMVYILGSEDGPIPLITRDVSFDPRQFLAAQTNDPSLRVKLIRAK